MGTEPLPLVFGMLMEWWAVIMVHFVSKLAFKPIARYVHAHSGGVCDRI